MAADDSLEAQANHVAPTLADCVTALACTLHELPDEGHHGWLHKGGPFRYRPEFCPGCRRAILQAMRRELAGH